MAKSWGRSFVVSLFIGSALICLWAAVDGGPLREKTSPPRTMDDYWRLSGLRLKEAEKVFEDSQCFLTELNYLGCSWALQSAAEKVSLFLNPIGIFDPKTAFVTIEKNPSHKEYLIDLENTYRLARASEFSFEAAWKYLKTRWIGTDKEAVITATVLNAFYSVILDPHSYLIPFDAFDSLVSASENSSVGIGVTLRRTEDRFRVTRVITGSSSDRKGLRKGDYVLALDQKVIGSLTDFQVSQILKGVEGSKILAKIKRENRVFDVELTRTLLRVKSVESQLIERRNHKVGLLTLSKFSSGSCDLMRKEIIHLVENGMKGLLLDLRDNPGGDIAESGCIANLFLKKKSLIYEIRYFGVSEKDESYIADQNSFYDGPLAVLINRSSASASEVLAGALQDHGRAVLVGERSFGKGSVQRGHAWSENPALALFSTDALFYLPSGRTPQIVGLYPDIEVIDVSNQDKREEDLFYNPIQPEIGSQSETKVNASMLKCRILEMAGLAQGLQPNEYEDTKAVNDPFVRQGQSLIQCLESQGESGESVNTPF
ncbi:MAG: S41 family peptidase [Pseudobdellovibrionaceae bacterium]